MLNFLERNLLRIMKLYVIEVSGEFISVKYFYDITNGLKIKEISTTNMGGQSQVQESIIGVYKDFEGLLFPTEKSQSLGPQSINMKLIDVILNSEISEIDFE